MKYKFTIPKSSSKKLITSHCIFLCQEQLKRLLAGETVDVIGSEHSVWMSGEQTTEPSEETTLVYKVCAGDNEINGVEMKISKKILRNEWGYFAILDGIAIHQVVVTKV